MKQKTKSYGLSDFVEEMTTIVENTTEDKERVAQAEPPLNKLIRTNLWLPQSKLQTNSNQYARLSLYKDPKDRFEVLMLIWKKGQHTPLHDHDGTWGIEGIVSGRMRVTNFLQIESYATHTIRLRHSGTMTLNERSTGELLPPADCHILEAIGDETTVTIHVYGKQLKKFRIFEPTDENEVYTIHNHYIDYTIGL